MKAKREYDHQRNGVDEYQMLQSLAINMGENPLRQCKNEDR